MRVFKLPGRRRRDVGAVGLEYIGAGFAVLTLVGALATLTGPGQDFTRAVGYNICKATGAECVPAVKTESDGGGPNTNVGPDGQPLRPGDPGYNGMTPEEQATWGDHAGVGDSYSSGEGAKGYIDGTDNNFNFFWEDDPKNMCHRSENSWTATVNKSFDFAGDFKFGACSGAVMEDYYSSVEPRAEDGNREGQPAQRDYVKNSKPSLVTMSMGGNDFGFSKVFEECLKSAGCFSKPGEVEAKKHEVYQKIWGVEWDDDPAVRAARERAAAANPPDGSLMALYAQIRQDVGPDARILVVGYPRLFPEDGSARADWILIGRSERLAINEMGAFGNSEIQRAVEASQSNAEFVDVTDALKGHELATWNPYIHDLDFGRGGPGPVSQQSYHPTKDGQDAIAEIVNEAVRKGRG